MCLQKNLNYGVKETQVLVLKLSKHLANTVVVIPDKDISIVVITGQIDCGFWY